MKIVDSRNQEARKESILSNHIPSGIIFQGEIEGHNLKYFLKVFREVISLEDTDKVWCDPIMITKYLPLSCEIVIKGVL